MGCQPEQERLPAAAEEADPEPGAARVCPRHAPPLQEPHGGTALPQEEARLHPQPGVGDQQTGETFVLFVYI